MRKIIFIIILLGVHSPANAGTYAVERSDGGVSVVHYFEDSQDSLSDVLNELGLAGRPIKSVDPETLPPKSDRKYWKFNDVPIGNPVVIDTVRKNADEAQALANENRRKALANKMGLTDSEYTEARGLGLL